MEPITNPEKSLHMDVKGVGEICIDGMKARAEEIGLLRTEA